MPRAQGGAFPIEPEGGLHRPRRPGRAARAARCASGPGRAAGCALEFLERQPGRSHGSVAYHYVNYCKLFTSIMIIMINGYRYCICI